MKRPSFQFYPADWRNNAKLRRCSEAARGVWMDVLCVLHDSDEYGVCRWPLADLARAAGTSLRLLKELVDKEVLKGGDKLKDPFIYTPRHAGKDGEPVTLIEANGGPCWYSSRLVRDEWVRLRRGSSTRFDALNQPTKAHEKAGPKQAPKVGIGGRQGDGPTSTSSSTTNTPVGVFAVSSAPTAGRFAMVSNWAPSEACVALARRRCVGIDRLEHDFIADAVPEFILYWRGRTDAAMDAGKWDTTFLRHVVKRWETFRAALNNPNSLPRPLAPDFFPNDKTIADLAVAGMDEQAMLASLDRFKRFHIEKGEGSCAWEYRFHRWALDDQVRCLQNGISIEQKLTDRSWAEADA